MKRRRWHRGLFAAAGVYNIFWGLYSAADPNWLFRFCGLAPINHPAIFAALGMVIGVYGILYLEVARSPERGFMLAAVGLLGKVFGPLGMLVLLVSGRWPLSASVLCLTNDVAWWIPFGLYLVDAWPFFHRDLRETYADRAS